MAVQQTRTRRVVVVRHAKAEDPAGRTDRDRVLTARGRSDAAAVGQLLGDVLDPDAETVVLVSSATRAVQTWAAVAAELTAPAEVQELDELYEAGAVDVVDMLALLPDEVDVAIVVGHNPTMQALVQQLEDGDDPEMGARLGDRGLPTAGVALLELDGDWTDLEPTSCRLVRLDVGRA